MTNGSAQSYPLTVTIGYPTSRSRWTVVARLPLAFPVLLFSILLNIGATVAIWAAIIASGRIPSWLFAFQTNVGRWHTRAAAYTLLLTDHYPVFEGDHPVSYELSEPVTVSRQKVAVWKFITAVPHFLVLAVLTAALVPVTVVAWIALVITGRHPLPLHQYGAGLVLWYARLAIYLQSQTDDFPAFSLRATAGRSSRRTYRLSAAVGLIPALPAGAFVAFLVYIIGFTGTHVTSNVSYDELRDGHTTSAATVESGAMRLLTVTDPADQHLLLLQANASSRYVAFTISIRNQRGSGETVPIQPSAFQLVAVNGQTHEPVLVAVDGAPGPGAISAGQTGKALVIFEVQEVQHPQRLTWDVVDYISIPRRGETIDWIFT